MKKIIGLAVIASSFGAMASEWDKITPSADFRYRLENYKDELNDVSRSRQRIRARVGLNYQVDEMNTIKLRLASGESKDQQEGYDSATSTNDTLGKSNGGSRAVYFDRAYLAQKMGDVKLNLGRMGVQFEKAGKNQLIWDSDMNLDGIHLGYSMMGAYVNLGSFWVKEISDSNDDVTIASSQLGYKGEAGSIAYNVGVSNYHYQFAHENTLGTGEGYNLLETYLELNFDLGMPVKFFATMVTNNEAEDDNKANIVGLELGKTKKKGSWKVGVNSRTVEYNSIYSSFMDGDFAGKTTDSSGTIVYGKYMTTDNAYLSVGVFNNTVNADEKADASKEAEAYTKLHVDYGIKF